MQKLPLLVDTSLEHKSYSVSEATSCMMYKVEMMRLTKVYFVNISEFAICRS